MQLRSIVTSHYRVCRGDYQSPSGPPTRTGRLRPGAGACATNGATSAPRGRASDCGGCGTSAASGPGVD